MAQQVALVTADNYPGISGAQLAGCVNDGRHMELLLERRGFEVRSLFDEQDTKANIEREVTDLVAALGPDDIGVWHRSSHGTQGAVHGDPSEPDLRQEGIVPYDFRRAGIIWDDWIRATLNRVHRHARMVVIMDTCFSGGVDRMAGPIGDSYRRVRYLPPSEWLRAADVEAHADQHDLGTVDARMMLLHSIAAVARQPAPKAYPVLLLAACQPHEVAYCIDIDGEPQGAFSWALRQVLEGSNPLSYRTWMYGSGSAGGVVTTARRQGLLPSVDAAQTPMLVGSAGRVRWTTLQP